MDVETVNQYLRWARDVRHLSVATRERYGRTLAALTAWDGATAWADVDTGMLRAFLGRDRPRGGTVGAATVKGEVAALRSFWGWLTVDHGLSAADPTGLLLRDVPRHAKPEPRPVDLATWQVLWRAELADDERVAFGLALFLGLRRAEVCSLTADQFRGDPDRIVGVRRKGGGRQTVRWGSTFGVWVARLPEWVGAPETFTAPLVRLLASRVEASHLLPWEGTVDTYQGRRGVPLPSGWLNPDQFNKRLRRACLRAGLAGDAVTPHQLRHTYGTQLCAAGIPLQVVSASMGHASLEMTTRYVALGADPMAPFGDTVDIPRPWGV